FERTGVKYFSQVPHISQLMLGRHAQVFDLMVARGGIEPPTRGFSIRGRKRRNRLTQQEFVHQCCEIFWRVTLGYVAEFYRYGDLIFHTLRRANSSDLGRQ